MARFIMVQVGEDSYDVLDSARMNSNYTPDDYHMGYNMSEADAKQYCKEVEIAYAAAEQADRGKHMASVTHWTNEDVAVLCKTLRQG